MGGVRHVHQQAPHDGMEKKEYSATQIPFGTMKLETECQYYSGNNKL